MISMFLSEIACISSEGQTHIFSGPIIKAKTFEEAELQAKNMNKDLYVIGEYFGTIGADNGRMEIS
tara:strand:- start:437 stop:634 length:198 start_codon:yes stop_codon:yes gene_type:complete